MSEPTNELVCIEVIAVDPQTAAESEEEIPKNEQLQMESTISEPQTPVESESLTSKRKRSPSPDPFTAQDVTEPAAKLITDEKDTCTGTGDRVKSDQPKLDDKPAALWNVREESFQPWQVACAWTEYSKQRSNNFLKGCKWSPDGSMLLTNSDDNCLRLYDLPKAFYEEVKDVAECDVSPVTRVQEGEIIYDYCWNPKMASTDPTTCCFATTCKDNPARIWDAKTGKLRGCYSGYNAVDEVEGAHSVAFSLDGTKLYCGYRNTIRVFDVEVPGRKCRETNTKKQGQVGIISSIVMNPANSDCYAVGSYLQSIGIYSAMGNALLFLLQGQQNGITHMQFSKCGNLLYSGSRKDEEILCWDLRYPGKVLYRMWRDVRTNQRIYFDISPDGKYIISGQNGGEISVWETENDPTPVEFGEPVLQPVFSFAAHNDCVNGVSIHPTMPVIASCSGQRKYPDVKDSDSSGEENDRLAAAFTSKNIVRENSVRFWWMGKYGS